MHAFKAVYLLGLMVTLNLLTIIGYFRILILNTSIFPSTYSIIILLFGTSFISHIFFLRNKKYFELIDKVKSISKTRRIVISYLYLFLTISLIFSLIWVKKT